jgi:hypothetical protein
VKAGRGAAVLLIGVTVLDTTLVGAMPKENGGGGGLAAAVDVAVTAAAGADNPPKL